MSEEFRIHYEFQNIKFDAAAGTNEGLAFTDGTLTALGKDGRFRLALAPKTDGEWGLRGMKFSGNMAEVFHSQHLRQDMLNRAAVLLKTINVWTAESDSCNGAQLFLNQQIAPSEFADRVVISFRPDMLSLPTANWDAVWHLIEGRVRSDQYFRVHGFSVDEVVGAIAPLKQIFNGPWVRAKYRKASNKNAKLNMATDFPQDTEYWFPAYHLARTALGAICVDPGWNYLVEIGLSIRELQGFDGLQRLTQQIARSPGTQHHLCLAAELYRRGHLLALEPQTGAGGSTNDLLVTYGDRQYEIEVKEFASHDPGKRLAREVVTKSKNLTEHPARPIVFHAVLIENGIFDKAKEDLFFQSIRELVQDMPRNISAVVAGRRFVDSSGGRVKRDAEIRILNPRALVQSNEEDLAMLFAKNYDTIQYPMFGIGSFFYFQRGSKESASA